MDRRSSERTLWIAQGALRNTLRSPSGRPTRKRLDGPLCMREWRSWTGKPEIRQGTSTLLPCNIKIKFKRKKEEREKKKKSQTNLGKQKCCRLVAFSCNYNVENAADGPWIIARPVRLLFNNTCPPEKPGATSWKKNAKQGSHSRSQFEDVTFTHTVEKKSAWKDAQHHSLSQKRKVKLPSDITAHHSDWAPPKEIYKEQRLQSTWAKGNCPTLFLGMSTVAATMEICMDLPVP